MERHVGLPGFTVTSALCQVRVVEDKPEGTDGRRMINNGDVGGQWPCGSGDQPLSKSTGGGMGYERTNVVGMSAEVPERHR